MGQQPGESSLNPIDVSGYDSSLPSESGANQRQGLGSDMECGTKEVNVVDTLLSMFNSQLTPKQIHSICKSDNNFDSSMKCILAGPTAESIVKLATQKYASYQKIKLQVDEDEAWADLM